MWKDNIIGLTHSPTHRKKSMQLLHGHIIKPNTFLAKCQLLIIESLRGRINNYDKRFHSIYNIYNGHDVVQGTLSCMWPSPLGKNLVK